MLTCPSCGRANPAEASFCMGCGGPLGATATAHETRRTVTALFCDLVGSTALGEQHDPEVLRGALERYFDLVQATVERHGGRVEKYVGDAVNGVFGLPAAHEDDALRAVRAGVEIQARLAGLAATSLVPIAARVGIHTGEVLAPGTGRPLIGDTMNTASRLQSSAEPGSVIIGEPTFRLVRDAVVAEPVEPLVLKGKAEPVAAYRVVAVASLSPMRTRRLDAPMVGRRREASLLADAFERAASDRSCVLFTVLGAAGAGKSRLVEEFLGARADGDAEILRGRCLAYGDGITWYPVTEALRGALDLPEFAEADAIRSALAAAVAGEEHAPAIEANLARLFAAGQGGSPEETFWAIRRFLESRGRQQPLILVLDDIHWGEPAFLDLVEHVADWSRDASILLLCMARPDLLDVRPAWGGGKTNATTISLAPLSATETDALIDGLLGPSALPLDIRLRISGVAEGNPLFVEEMLRMLVDDGRLIRDGVTGTWSAESNLVDVTIPPTISALLSARLDRLSDHERMVAEAASVAGMEFHRGAVAALVAEPTGVDLALHLRSLTRKELVTPERSSLPGEDAYRFRHLLIRDAAYDAIPKSARAQLHRAFADWLEGVAGDRIEEQQEIVGHHLAAAYRYRAELGLQEDRELRLRAARALGGSGHRALDDGDMRAALELLQPAADLAWGDPLELEILDDLGSALRTTGDPERHRRACERLASVARVANDVVYEMRARLAILMLDLRVDLAHPHEEERQALAEEALDTYRAHGADAMAPSALLLLADVEWERGSLARALEFQLQALDAANRLGLRYLSEVAVWQVMTTLELGATPLSEALDRVDHYIETLPPTPALSLMLRRERTWVNTWLGREDDAGTDLRASKAMNDQLGNRFYEFQYPMLEGYVAWVRSDLALAAVRFRQGIDILKSLGDLVNIPAFGPSLARVLLDMGRPDEAAEVTGDFRDNRVSLTARVNTKSIDARLAALKGDVEDALRLSDEAVAIVTPTDFLVDQADVALDRAHVLLLAGRPNDARASSADALARYEHKEYAIGIRRAREFLAALPG